MQEEITLNIKKCSRFNNCSINLCPLDLEANLRKNILNEKQCPFTINKKSKFQKGIRTQMPSHILKFVPKSNLKILNKRNQKRWRGLRNNN